MKEQMKQIPRMLHVQIVPEIGTHFKALLQHSADPPLSPLTKGPIFNLPTFPVGRAAYPLSQMLSVVKDIEALPSGSKLITFRSPIVIRNRTPVRLAVQVTPAAAPIEEMVPIESNGCSAVPVRYAHKAGLRFRATDFPSYDWSDQSINTMVHAFRIPCFHLVSVRGGI